MKLKIVAERLFVLNQVRQMSNEIEEENKSAEYNSVVENAISELIKIDMRKLAHRDPSSARYSGDQILYRTLDTVTDTLRSAKPGFDFSKYLTTVEKKMRAPARELSELSTKLGKSRELARTGQQTSVEGAQPYAIKELGLKGAIEGFLVYPTAEVVEIDLDKLRQSYVVEGEWFPFQVTSDDLTFVIDDDGSIFTSVEHFSERTREDAKRILEGIARVLYV